MIDKGQWPPLIHEWLDPHAGSTPTQSDEIRHRVTAALRRSPATPSTHASLPAMATDAPARDLALFLEMTRHVANGDMATATELLLLQCDDDAEVAYRHQIVLLGFAPFIIAIGLRRLGFAPGDDQLCIIDPTDRTADATSRIALQLMAEALNSTDLNGTASYTTDVVVAHEREHGPIGLAELLLRLLRYSAYVLTHGGYQEDFRC